MDFNSPPLVGTMSKMKQKQFFNNYKQRDVTANEVANHFEERHLDDIRPGVSQVQARRNNPSRNVQEENNLECIGNNTASSFQRPQQLDNYLQQQWLQAQQRQHNSMNNEMQQRQDQLPQLQVSQSFQFSNSFQVQQLDGWQGQQQYYQQADQYRNQGCSSTTQQQIPFQHQSQQQVPYQYQTQQQQASYQYQPQQNLYVSEQPSCYQPEGNNLPSVGQRFSMDEGCNQLTENRFFPGENCGPPDEDIQRYGGQCSPVRNRYSPEAHRRPPSVDRHYPNRYSPAADQYYPDLDRTLPDVDRFSPIAKRHSPGAERYSPEARRYSPEPRHHSPVAERYSRGAHRYSPIGGCTSISSRRSSPEANRYLAHSDRSSRTKDRLKPWSKFGSLPGLGKPGGLDDPNRRGLSGAGVKWYLRYLQSGLEPDLARAKVDERRKIPANVLNSSCSTSIGRNSREVVRKSPRRHRHSPLAERPSPTQEKLQSRRSIPKATPVHGKPGGANDPNRSGLSGAGIKWYLRYLESGLSPDVARAKVEERRKFPRPVASNEEGDIPRPRKASNSLSVGEAEEPKSNTFPLHDEHEDLNDPNRTGLEPDEEMKTSSPFSVNSESKLSKRIAVLPANYPNDVLTYNELTELQEDILMEVAKGWSHKIMFDAVHFKESMIIIDCANESTADWLSMKVPQLTKWQEKSLTTRKGSDIPLPYVITVFLPRSLGSDQTQLLTLIDAQNEGLNVGNWRVMSLKEQGKGQLLIAGIDERSKNAIVRLGHSLRYRFGKVAVHGLKKISKNT